jgi:hypothetical protein
MLNIIILIESYDFPLICRKRWNKFIHSLNGNIIIYCGNLGQFEVSDCYIRNGYICTRGGYIAVFCIGDKKMTYNIISHFKSSNLKTNASINYDNLYYIEFENKLYSTPTFLLSDLYPKISYVYSFVINNKQYYYQFNGQRFINTNQKSGIVCLRIGGYKFITKGRFGSVVKTNVNIYDDPNLKILEPIKVSDPLQFTMSEKVFLRYMEKKNNYYNYKNYRTDWAIKHIAKYLLNHNIPKDIVCKIFSYLPKNFKLCHDLSQVNFTKFEKYIEPIYRENYYFYGACQLHKEIDKNKIFFLEHKWDLNYLSQFKLVIHNSYTHTGKAFGLTREEKKI